MITLKNISFQYKNTDALGRERKTRGLEDLTLSVQKGEFVVLAGDSGCGKTTITRLINGLVPHYYEGDVSGEVSVAGIDVQKADIGVLSAHVGSVFQNPRSQFFNVDTTSEMAFVSENLCVEPDTIRQSILRVVQDMRMENLVNRSIFALSGGEKQKVACASVAVAEPDIMVLDEPSSNLDAAGIEDLKNTLSLWKAKGKTVVIAEHRLYYLTALLDRLIILKNGRIEAQFSGKEVRSMTDEAAYAMGLRSFHKVEIAPSLVDTGAEASEALICRGFAFRYKNTDLTLCFPELRFPRGRITAVIGRNGAGKSTFARLLCGLERRGRGEVSFAGRLWNRKLRSELCYMIMQDVNHQLFTESVLDEVILSMPAAGMNDERESKARGILRQLDLEDLADVHPMALSGGQKQRVAIASGAACESPVLLFDEPTSGLDLNHMRQVADILRMLRGEGKTVIVITHDTELVREVADHVIDFDLETTQTNVLSKGV